MKRLRKETQDATLTFEYVKILQDLYVENSSLKENQREVDEVKQYVLEYATAKAA